MAVNIKEQEVGIYPTESGVVLDPQQLSPVLSVDYQAGGKIGYIYEPLTNNLPISPFRYIDSRRFMGKRVQRTVIIINHLAYHPMFLFR